MRLITVNGRLASDVTRQISKQGTEFINFSIANSEYGDPKSSDGVPQTQWFRVTSFSPQHINMAKYLTKGKPIVVSGRYSNRLYQSQKTGQWGIDNDIIATDIFFELGGERNDNGVTKANNTQNGGTVTMKSVSDAIDAIPQVTSTRMGQQGGIPQDGGTPYNPPTAVASNDDDDLPF